jgi:sarcosine oxidase subunit alpha
VPDEPREAAPWPVAEPDGYVCVCEDVSMHDLEQAWDEGWTSSEILKRYTTATMGPCQGALCSRHLAEHARAKGAGVAARGRTTARPPVRAPRLGDLIGGVHEQVERRTALHDRHVDAGARIDHSGVWLRPGSYGDVAAEIRAVRERVGVMDVSTLGKFLVAGRDARVLLDRVFPLDVAAIAPGRARYLLALDEAGYVMDDGLVAALPDGSYYVTSTSGGADRMESWLRNWIDRLDLHAHLVDLTAQLGAINVAGPHARDLLATLSDDDLSREAIPYPGHAEIVVAGVACRAIAVGFVGELSYELHHPRGGSVELWDALLTAGAPWGAMPHGLDALDVLRLEKGHVYLAQDTMPDDHPTKLGLGWAVAKDKPAFVGKRALERMDALPLERRLVGLRFDGAPQRGHPLTVDGEIVGRVTSCTVSAAAGGPVGLGWVRAIDGVFPQVLHAGHVTAAVSPTPFYDPEGVRLRG